MSIPWGGQFFIRRLSQFFLSRRHEVFYPQISPIHADYGGLSCRCAAIHAAGFFCGLGQITADCRCLSRRREVFYPQITPISADYGACLAAGFFADWGRLAQIAGVSRDGATVFYPQISQIVADYGGLSCRCAAFFKGLPIRQNRTGGMPPG
ncbi:MAG: hypothetical protein ACOX9E_10550 [Lentisphaeria bacterium]